MQEKAQPSGIALHLRPNMPHQKACLNTKMDLPPTGKDWPGSFAWRLKQGTGEAWAVFLAAHLEVLGTGHSDLCSSIQSSLHCYYPDLQIRAPQGASEVRLARGWFLLTKEKGKMLAFPSQLSWVVWQWKE